MAELRRRLEGLPDSHPSAGSPSAGAAEAGRADRDAPASAEPGEEAGSADGDGGPAADAGDQPQPGEAAPADAGDRPAAGPFADRRASGPDGSSGLPGGDPRGPGHDPLLPYGPLASSRGGYRPWFTDGGVPAPWFAAEVREDQDD
ncbi:MAG: hypothetical protein ACLPN6_12575 [Streptosporangiaceae bacterium]|nr:hypothetical protein [Actinomycetota bacterium]